MIIEDITETFTREDVSFDIFKKLVKSGSNVRCIVTKNTKDKPRSFFDNIDRWAKDEGASGLAYFTIENEITAKGPVGKFFSKESLEEIMKKTTAKLRQARAACATPHADGCSALRACDLILSLA